MFQHLDDYRLVDELRVDDALHLPQIDDEYIALSKPLTCIDLGKEFLVFNGSVEGSGAVVHTPLVAVLEG